MGISGGCEAAIHSARRYLETLPPDHGVVKLEFSNAFNSLHRLDMLNAILDRLPNLYSYCISPCNAAFGPLLLLLHFDVQRGTTTERPSWAASLQ